jgi:hypothetical protein
LDLLFSGAEVFKRFIFHKLWKEYSHGLKYLGRPQTISLEDRKFLYSGKKVFFIF